MFIKKGSLLEEQRHLTWKMGHLENDGRITYYPQHDGKRANMAYFGDSLKLCEAMLFQNMALAKEEATITIKGNEIAII